MPSAPATPSGTHKLTYPRTSLPVKPEHPASGEARPPRTASAAAKPHYASPQPVTPDSKLQGEKEAERKPPVSKSPRVPAQTERHEVEKKPVLAEPTLDQRGLSREQQSVPRGEKKRRRRRHKPAMNQPIESPPEVEPVEVSPTQTEDIAEVPGETPERKRKRREGPIERREKPPEQREELPERRETPPERREKPPERKRKDLPPFGNLVLSDDMLEALADAGYQEPTPVQAGLIPKALEGRDLMGQARTGTGKTAAFGIPLLERFGSGEKRSETAALILVPTRELAVQVRDEITKLTGRRRATTVAVYGGKPIRGQIEHLRRGAELVVGTPGRVIDLIDRRALNLAAIQCVVLDEADRMLDIGFRPDIEKILRRCPQSRQTLLFSATIPPPVKHLAERYMHEPEMLDFSPQDVAVETIEQFYFTVDPRQKFDLLAKLIEREDPKQAIIFCRTKKGTDRVGTRLAKKMPGTAMIHGDLQQRQRDRVMADFRAGNVRFLVATDVVGRGIDVSGISHIINFDIPEFCDDYIHRVGRTGRMGREGVAYTFVSPEEGNELTRIEMRINRLLIRDEMPGFLAVPKPEPTPETEAQPADEAAKPKSVFGKWTRRIRRAL